VKTLPATVIVALRLVPAVLAATLYPTGPVPDPDEPLVMVSHDAPLDAVRAQPVVVVTVKVADPPPVANDAEAGVSVKLHQAAACVTVTVGRRSSPCPCATRSPCSSHRGDTVPFAGARRTRG
jgi:hypothetical protein